MSQEKVDRYKKEKANRVQLQKKEKEYSFLKNSYLVLLALYL